MADTSACGLHPNDWRYVSEGGANIVLAYHGPPHSTFSHHLLRLAKSSSSSSRPTPHRQVAFQTRVVAKMLPPEFLLPFRVVQVSLEWLSAISQQLAESRVRPQDRVDKGGIDEEATEALLVRDMVSGDGVLTVEIKVGRLSSSVASRTDDSTTPSLNGDFYHRAQMTRDRPSTPADSANTPSIASEDKAKQPGRRIARGTVRWIYTAWYLNARRERSTRSGAAGNGRWGRRTISDCFGEETDSLRQPYVRSPSVTL